MKGLISLIRCWFGMASVSRSMDALNKKIKDLEREKIRFERELDKRQRAMEKLETWLKEESSRNLLALKNAHEANSKMFAALSTAQEQVKTFEEITIPGLVASNQLLIKRWEAETAVHVMRQVDASVKDRERV